VPDRAARRSAIDAFTRVTHLALIGYVVTVALALKKCGHKRHVPNHAPADQEIDRRLH
jgi:hypothetical protein